MIKNYFVCSAFLLLLTGCDQGAPQTALSVPQDKPTPNSLYLTPENFQLPSGDGCLGAIARYKATLDNDLVTGNVNEKVYDAIMREIAPAQKACASGNDAGARGIVAGSRKNHGYPEG